jgi:hypothetical protein
MNPKVPKVILETRMEFLLITPNGKVYTFHVKSVAETYQQAYGGTLTDHSITTTAPCQAPTEVDLQGQVFQKSLTIH